jgi:tetratricopeptide (TPR) repeat protein
MEMGKYDEAKLAFERSVKLTNDSNLSQEIKSNAALVLHDNLARVALGKKDVATAKKETEEFRKGAEQQKNSLLIKQAHELNGMIALAEKNYGEAIAQLQQSNLQDPYNLFRLGEAHQGKGDAARAKEFYGKAARFNSLPLLNYAFVRTRATKLAV